jgi:hypothetical protein
MRFSEIMEDLSAATTGTGNIAELSHAMNIVQRRIPLANKTTKYSNGPAANYASPKRKPNAR